MSVVVPSSGTPEGRAAIQVTAKCSKCGEPIPGISVGALAGCPKVCNNCQAQGKDERDHAHHLNRLAPTI